MWQELPSVKGVLVMTSLRPIRFASRGEYPCRPPYTLLRLPIGMAIVIVHSSQITILRNVSRRPTKRFSTPHSLPQPPMILKRKVFLVSKSSNPKTFPCRSCCSSAFSDRILTLSEPADRWSQSPAGTKSSPSWLRWDNAIAGAMIW